MSEIAGRTCFQMEGTLSGDYARKLNAHSFQLFVDEETGVLLQYENYDENGNLTDQLKTNRIRVNQTISDEVFDNTEARYFK